MGRHEKSSVCCPCRRKAALRGAPLLLSVRATDVHGKCRLEQPMCMANVG